MTEDTFSHVENKDFARIVNSQLQQQTAHSKQSVSDLIQASVKILDVDFHHSPLSAESRDEGTKTLAFNRKMFYWGNLNQVLYSRDIRTAIDAMAYTFYRDYDIEVIFILYGVGANGKTVFTSLLTHLQGKNNVSNVPLPTILRNRFALSDLENKDLNIDNELPGYMINEAVQS